MRYLILSDIHANLEALEAVLQAAPRDEFERLLILGDIVGYGADPNRVVDRVRELRPDVIIRGNHDKVSSGIESAEGFNFAARQAAEWTFDSLTDENRAYLAALPVGPVLVDDDIELCHGSPLDEDSYIFENIDAIEALRAMRRPICFFGHTHVPIAFWLGQDGFDLQVAGTETQLRIPLVPDRRYLINPGSVGQPRDGDPRAAYAVYDATAREVMLCRVPYPVDKAQAKIVGAGLPEGLARRLGLGK